MKLSKKARFFVSILVLTTLLFSPLLHIQPIALAASPDIVISQVYGGGGNTGATYTHDFIELFNRGTTSVSLSSWSVQYASATGAGNFGSSSTQITELPAVILNPGQYYLIQEAQGSGGTTALPIPDLIDSSPIPLSGTGGKVALVTSITPLGCNGGSTPCSTAQLALIKDLVGWDGANFYEGSGPAPATTNPTSVQRLSNGCTDTDNNSVDFSVGTPIPRNTASPLNVCPTSTNPSGVGAANPSMVFPGDNSLLTVSVTPGANPTSTGITVTGDLSSIGGSATQTFYDDGSNGDATAGDNTFSYLATVPSLTTPGQKTLPTTIADAQARSSTANISLGVRPSIIPIHDIQGAFHTSPYLGYWVSTQGIVTAITNNGFFVQDPNPDSNDATSEAIFFFNSSVPPVSVGDDVIVTGTVAEFRPGGITSGNLTTTELSTPNRIITVVSSGNPLPAATVVGSGGRTPPTQVIEDDSTSGNVETDNIFDPSDDGIDFYESLEAMLLQVNNAVAVAPTNSFGEIPVLADNGANASVRTNRGGVVIQASDFNPERIILDDTITATPIMDTGDSFTGPVTGVLDYSFGNYKLLALSPVPAVLSNGLLKEVTTDPTTYQLSVASFNVENLDPTDPQSKFDTLAGEIVNNLKSPDLIGLQEIQDNNGATNNGVVDADQTFAKLIAAIQAAGGPTYDYRQINPVDLADGGEPGGNIRVGFLFRTDRGLAFVDRAGGTSTNATTAVSGTSSPELTFSPGRVDPTNAAFTDSRKPLAAEFSFKGDKVFVVVNHLNSKGGDTPLFGFLQPPDLVSEVQRLQQAQVVNDFVDSILAIDAGANVIVLGDLNDFQFSAPLATLKGGVLNDLVNTLPVAEQYTYVFDGNSQVLDHILIGNTTFARPFTYDIVHMNAEYFNRPTDHDPQVANLCVDATPPTISGTLSPGVLWPANHKYVTVYATVQFGDNADPSSVIQLVSVTSNEPDNGLGDGDTPNDIVIVDDFTFKLRAERSGTGQGRVYTVTYQVTDACGNSTLASGNVYVPHDKKDRPAGNSPINVVSQTVAGLAPASSTPVANNRVFLPLIKR